MCPTPRGDLTVFFMDSGERLPQLPQTKGAHLLIEYKGDNCFYFPSCGRGAPALSHQVPGVTEGEVGTVTTGGEGGGGHRSRDVAGGTGGQGWG